jgi:hypothetical protein
MPELYQSLSHSKRDCKYHIMFVPKRRRKVMFGQTRRHSEREERDRHCPIVRQGAFLGPRLRRLYGRLRTGTSPQIHPRARNRGWNKRAVLNC